MSFRFCDSMITDYWREGYMVFRRILPASLLRDLRPEADKARAIAHAELGPQAQRLPPIHKYADRINQKPFEDYKQLPELCDAIQRLLGPAIPGAKYLHSSPGVLKILVEPVERPRHHGWHRDWVVNYPLAEQTTPKRIAEFTANWHTRVNGNQINCAIYPDSCLWYVPGSYSRMHDLPGEKQTCCYHTEPNPFDEMQGSHAELERIFLEECLRFPGAVRVQLDPGDFCVYRSYGWHTGVYSTHQPRATLHDTVLCNPPAAN